jgi:hypothetical protein
MDDAGRTDGSGTQPVEHMEIITTQCSAILIRAGETEVGNRH